jgi:tagatose 1,6-diphosphate aldolase
LGEQSVISEAKQRRLQAISTPAGIIAALAMDQRRSLRGMIARAAGVPLQNISDNQLSDFKSAVTSVLTPQVSAVLLDPEYGLAAAAQRAPDCGLLLTYESDGYENPRPHRMLALMPNISGLRLLDLGADAVKILLSYSPDDDAQSNLEKRVWIERIGNECDALGLPFLLEPVVYDIGGGDPGRVEFARRKPELVIRSMQEFSKPLYKVDVLKVEFPVAACMTGVAFSRDEALDYFRAADAAATVPYIYLSAGAEIADFVGSLELAVDAGARFSGVLCGRAMWQDGIPAFATKGRGAFSRWLETEGVRNAQCIVERLRSATPWSAHAAGASQ